MYSTEHCVLSMGGIQGTSSFPEYVWYMEDDEDQENGCMREWASRLEDHEVWHGYVYG